MRLPKQTPNVDLSLNRRLAAAAGGGVVPAGAVCNMFPETCSLGL